MEVKKKLYKKELKEELADIAGYNAIASEKKNFDFFEVVEYLNHS